MILVLQMLPVTRKRLAPVSADAALAEVASLLCLEHTNVAVVCDKDGAMVGVITDSDVVRTVAECDPPHQQAYMAGQQAYMAGAATAMTCNVISCRAEDRLRDVWSMMRQHGLRHIPVLVDDDRPVGVLYGRDALNTLFEDLQVEEREMRDFLLGVGCR